MPAFAGMTDGARGDGWWLGGVAGEEDARFRAHDEVRADGLTPPVGLFFGLFWIASQ
jgi:hypothetical protein